LLVDDLLEPLVDLLPLGKDLIEMGLPHYRPQGGLGDHGSGRDIICHLNDRSLGIDDMEVDDRVHSHRDVVPGYDFLSGNIHGNCAEIQADHLVDDWDEQDEPRPLGAEKPPETEDDPPLVFPEDADGRPENKNSQDNKGEYEPGKNLVHYRLTLPSQRTDLERNTFAADHLNPFAHLNRDLALRLPERPLHEDLALRIDPRARSAFRPLQVADAHGDRAPLRHSEGRPRLDLRGAPRAYWLFLGVSLLFAFGNSSDVFVLLRAQDLGFGLSAVILGYALYNLTYALLSFPAGVMADRVGPRPVLALGYLVFGGVYLGFAVVEGTGAVWPLFAAYGVVMALTEGVGRAWVAGLAPVDRRGSFLGLYHTGIGLTAVLASVLAGVLWDQVSPAAPFAVGAATGLAAGALLMGVVRTPPVGEARA